jgi:hypothetical protein
MPRYTTTISAHGPDGSIFVIGGRAGRLLRELGHSSDEIAGFRKRLSDASSYDAACAIVEKYFPLDRDEDC